jgi:hypothetical protein
VVLEEILHRLGDNLWLDDYSIRNSAGIKRSRAIAEYARLRLAHVDLHDFQGAMTEVESENRFVVIEVALFAHATH